MKDNHIDYSTLPFHFEALEDGIIQLRRPDRFSLITPISLIYSFDNKTWKEWKNYEKGISIKTGSKLYLKACPENATFYKHYNGYTFSTTNKVNVAGNIMSLLYFFGDIENHNCLPSEYCFYRLFLNCHLLQDASNLILPANNLTKCCYAAMFDGCTSLLKAPKLPATNLAQECYYNMFLQCKNLVHCPELPATKLSNGCYSRMFMYCSSLVDTPELPATELAENCYTSMFEECEVLEQAPEVLPATNLKQFCYFSMFRGCRCLCDEPKISALPLIFDKFYFDGYNAQTILNDICKGMFFGCNNIKKFHFPELAKHFKTKELNKLLEPFSLEQNNVNLIFDL